MFGYYNFNNFVCIYATLPIMKLMKSAVASAFLITATCAFASNSDSIQFKAPEEHLISLDAEARFDWEIVTHDGYTDHSNTGFVGKYIAVKAHGQIIDGLSYTWRQRFSRTPKDASFWDQNDVMELNYKWGKFDFGAGKQVVMIGGYEYNLHPIDLMCPNIFVTNIACYQFGISAGYQVSPNDYLSFQITQSPYAHSGFRDLYAFNLQWQSQRVLTDRLRFENIWSINEIEYTNGKFCNFVALGNKLVLDSKFTFILDLMTRTYPRNHIFKNNTFMGEVSWDINRSWRLTGKISYDCNMGKNLTPYTEVARGSEITMGGVVAEWFPIHKNNHLLRLHASAFFSGGKNNSDTDLMQAKTFYASVGLTWHMNLLNFK